MIYTFQNTVEIGKPVRVYVNGNEVKEAVMADTEKGVVEYIPTPIRAKKNSDELYTRKLRGVVTVVPMNDR